MGSSKKNVTTVQVELGWEELVTSYKRVLPMVVVVVAVLLLVINISSVLYIKYNNMVYHHGG